MSGGCDRFLSAADADLESSVVGPAQKKRESNAEISTSAAMSIESCVNSSIKRLLWSVVTPFPWIFYNSQIISLMKLTMV